VLGLSSSVSLVKDNPAAAVNRRISIVVLSRRAEQRIDQQYLPGASGINLNELVAPERAASQSESGQAGMP
jgi:chemotaxis protein MotB